MTKLWLPLLMVTPLQLVHSQEVKHAPTVEQCRADQKLWFSKLIETDSSQSNLPGWEEMWKWSFEMSDCQKVDADFFREYGATDNLIAWKLINRFAGFIGRHHLTDQFTAEDAQGKR